MNNIFSESSMKELVSIIMPVYNGEKYIFDAISSVLNQSYNNLELLIVDDSSTDNTKEIIKKFSDERIKIINNVTNIGVAASRNVGIDSAKGEYIAFIDADDVWVENKIATQISYLKDWDFICSSYDFVDNNGKEKNIINIAKGRITKQTLLKNNVIGCSTVIAKREIFTNHKFDSRYKHEDYVLWLNIVDEYRAFGIVDILVHYRSHDGGRNSDKISAAVDRWKVYRDYLGMSLFESSKYFLSYAFSSIKKYQKRR